jgi:hypothetical protein
MLEIWSIINWQDGLIPYLLIVVRIYQILGALRSGSSTGPMRERRLPENFFLCIVSEIKYNKRPWAAAAFQLQ